VVPQPVSSQVVLNSIEFVSCLCICVSQVISLLMKWQPFNHYVRKSEF
jgi:hypothetical protein